MPKESRSSQEMRIREVDRVVPWHRNHPRNPRAVSLAASAVCSSPDPRAMEGARFRELVLDHARCHKVLANISEEREVAKLVEVVKEYMRLKAKHFVAKCENRAILFSYGSDNTPLLTRASFSHVLDGKRVVRNAGKAEEFLIEREASCGPQTRTGNRRWCAWGGTRFRCEMERALGTCSPL